MAHPLQGLQPCPSVKQTQSSPWSQSHRDAVPSPAEVPFLVPLTLSLPACLLCKRSEADPDICGEKLERCGLCAHMFCLFFASLLHHQRKERVGFLGILPKDILLAVNRMAQKRCFICDQSGATITCCKMNCHLSFHLPCAKEAGCVTQYITPYRSYCPAHRPQQAAEATPEPGTQCLICMEPVEDRQTFNTMVCPECKSTWFHRDCIQRQALSAGILSFQCPLCRGSQEFLVDMFTVGIRVPFREPLWEEGDAFRDLGVRHRQCNARECLYPGGREEAEEDGPWEMLLCCSCAAEGTHKRCSSLTDSTTSWECSSCAPLDTAPGNESELDIPDLGTQDSSSSTSPGPDLTQNGSCQQGQAPDPQGQRRTLRDRTHVPAPSAGRRQPRQRQSGTSRRQNRSRLQRQTTDQHGRSRTRRDRRRARSPGAGSGSSSKEVTETSHRRKRPRLQCQTPDPSGSSTSRCDRSRVRPPSTGSCSPNQEASGTCHRQNRSRLQRQTTDRSRRSRSRRDRKRARSPSAGSRSSSEEVTETSRRRKRPRLQRQTTDPSSQSRSRHDRSCLRRPSTGSCRSRQESSGGSRRQNRSRQRQNSDSSSLSRRPHDRSCRPAPSAGRRNPRQNTSRTSRRRNPRR
ncbi:PHD finger protein 7 [Pithys albifrons albifrons]|uniref:PHD finger protein 7 n=1 Tax=Pithys albifrons albifrons TaxID=3385563 RepID=UPI003A5CA8B4